MNTVFERVVKTVVNVGKPSITGKNIKIQKRTSREFGTENYNLKIAKVISHINKMCLHT